MLPSEILQQDAVVIQNQITQIDTAISNHQRVKDELLKRLATRQAAISCITAQKPLPDDVQEIG